MSKLTRYYVSRRHPLTWAAAALAVASVVLQILSLCSGREPGAGAAELWLLKVLPIWVGVGFAFILLLRGPREFYRSTKPVFWMCVYFGYVALHWHQRLVADPGLAQSIPVAYQLFAYRRYVVACWVLYLTLYCIYRLFMLGKFKRPIALNLVMLAPVLVLAYDLAAESPAEGYYLLEKLSNLLLVAAGFVASCAMQPFSDGGYHPTWGDRKDGRRLRSNDLMMTVAGYIMPDRNDACNNIQDTVEISAVEAYIHKKRAEGLESFGLIHVFLAAYVRCVAKYPGLNRFFSGQRVYQRDDDIQFTMTIKKEMRTDSPETTIKLHLSRSDTAEDVYHKLNALIEEVKNTPLDSSFDNLVALLASFPGLLLKFVVWCLKVADYFGKLPRFLTELSPFHGSVIFTSMGSLGIPPIVHHLYNFGNLPVFLAFGRKYRKYELDSQGNVLTRRYVDIVLNTDERTVDGFYYAAVLKYFHKIARRPSVLDTPPEEIVRDID